MASNTHTTLAELLANSPDPDFGVAGTTDAAYRVEVGAPGPDVLFRQLTHATLNLAYLGHDSRTHNPMVFSLPFSAARPGGNADWVDILFACCGDVSARGITPPLVVLSQDLLDATTAIAVPTVATLAAIWDARPGGQHGIDIPGADTEQVTTRSLVPIPHQYVPPLLQAHASGTLTWSWVYEHVIQPILGDGGQTQAFAGFVDYFRVAGMRLPNDNHGNPVYPPTEFEYTPVYGWTQVLDMQGAMLNMRLGGLRGPSNNLEVQLDRMSSNTQLLAQNLTNQTPPVKTLATELPLLAEMACKVSEQPSIATLPKFWENYHKLPKGGVLSQLDSFSGKVASDDGTMAPIFPVSFATDFSSGTWLAPSPGDVHKGISPARLCTPLSHRKVREATQRQAHAFITMTQLDGNNGQAIQLALTEVGMALPRTLSEFQAWVQAWYNFAAACFGKTSSYTQPIQSHILDNMSAITALVLTEYHDEVHGICLIMVAYICRMANHKLHDMLNGPAPTAANPTPSTFVPPYRNILDTLSQGSILSLTRVPPALAWQLPQAAPAPVQVPPGPPAPAHAPPPAQAAAPAPRRPQAPQPPAVARPRNEQVHNPDQNPDLKRAWQATGDDSLFTPGSRFHDANGPQRKKLVMRLAGDTQQRICIAMACKGTCFSSCRGYHGPLTPEECQAVATAGDLQL